jgi:predicted PurR-regulated permease PerM
MQGTPTTSSPLTWVVAALSVAALLVLWPMGPPLVLAAWSATIARPFYRSLTQRIHQRQGAAAMVTVLLVTVLLAPPLIIALSLSGEVLELGQHLLKFESGAEALKALTGGEHGSAIGLRNFDWKQSLALLERHGRDAMGAASTVFGAVAMTVVSMVVFVVAFYTFLVEGHRAHAWLMGRSALSPQDFERFAAAFTEVGRGLLVGVGLTALIQGALAATGYLITEVPRPLLLGLVTVLASLIPTIGSALVWVPVTVGLLLSGRPGAALAMFAIGCVVSVIDNVFRPLLIKYGRLHMHGALLFVAMLGGMTVFGGAGLLWGPLVVRLAIEGLNLQKEKGQETHRLID